MTDVVTIEMPGIPPAEVRGNSRAHYMRKYLKARGMKEDAYFMALHESDAAFLKARVTYHFHHWRSIDLDNLAIGCKPWLDGIVDSGLIKDDSPEHVTFGEHTFTKCKKGEEKTVITVEVLQ